MIFPWDDPRRAFADAARWFVRTAALVGDRWDRPGLGGGTSALVGHTSRSLLTVEMYLARPAAAAEVASAGDYFRATREMAAGPDVAARMSGTPGPRWAPIQRLPWPRSPGVVPLVDACEGTELVTTIAGGMRLADYLPTRTFELAVHTADLATALGLPLDVPSTAAGQALELVVDLAVSGGRAGSLLLAATGRPLAAGFSVL